jgi:hypothetical protein
MNLNQLAKHYDKLDAEERFALIFNAGVRGDREEQQRLASLAPRIAFEVPHQQPVAQAFNDLAEQLFLELHDLAAHYLELLAESREAQYEEGDEDDDDLDCEDDEDSKPAADMPDPDSDAEESERAAGLPEGGDENSASLRLLWLAMGDGFMLKTKVAGWRLWCARRHLPSFAVWEILPGWKRLKRAVDHAEGTPIRPGCAFAAEGMRCWLNDIRPEQSEPITELRCTAESIAGELEEWFQHRLHRHGCE